MTFFEDSLERLKKQLHLHKDQEIAAALGMSKSAFAERKKRDAFPDEKLWALAQNQPELNIDVLGVLTGISTKGHKEIALHNRASDLMHVNADDFESIKRSSKQMRDALRYAPLSSRESLLLAQFNNADEVGKKHIETAAKLAAK